VPAPPAARAVLRLLRSQGGPFQPKPALPPLDELIATVLSQHTSDRNSERAFATLRERFPTWAGVLEAPTEAVADAIRAGGIANQKAVRIQRILAEIEAREGRLDLARLEDLPDAEVEAYLTSLPGVGPKTAACVLVFAMGRAAFPVDTHVHRVATRLGWVPAGTGAAEAHGLLRRRVPADIRYDLHLALVAHGRTTCRARRPRCGACPLLRFCACGRQIAT
jgi:endonuclease III